MSIVGNRYDFVYCFDCQDGNPNGDPDADNSPRFDPETFQGLVSDVCLKRKIRDYVYQKSRENGSVQKGYDVFVLAGNTLESRQKRPYEHLKDEITPKGKDTKPDDIRKAREWMCANFFDIRAFGAVMGVTEFNCGQVRGPVQFTFARSIDRIFTTEHTISRQAFTGEKDVKPGTGTFGRKHTVAYGLYRAYGFVNPVFADQTGFSEDDLQQLWMALWNMFSIDRSAARGLMAARELCVFKHKSKLGEAPAHKLFDSMRVELKQGVVSPRSF
ncbi:MAG: type I-C CRISPR-associated protein Cas7/Csd2, partial [Acidobacteriaceae bacterium]|nr:type I-C CRISPR-associated protein Cas7/Csd2 [Acidobacteriaceae bacterium]